MAWQLGKGARGADAQGEAAVHDVEDTTPAGAASIRHGLGEAPAPRGEARAARAGRDERHGDQEAQQRRRAVLILYCTLTLSHYALLLVTVMSDEDKSWISGKLSKHTFTCICIMFSLFDQIEKSYKEKWWRTRLYDWLNYGARGISIGKKFVDVDLYF